MDLLLLLKLFLILGSIDYAFAIIDCIIASVPRITIRNTKKEKESIKDGRNDNAETRE